MPRYKAIIAYDGTNYCGFQRQDNGRTVQEAIETTLKRFTNGQLIEIHGSGRTDSGVHALKQVIHFDYPTVMDDEKFRYALDTQTPDDIACLSVEQVDASFHSRYLVKEKTYIYRLDVGKPRNPFKRHYASFYPYPLDVKVMQHAVRDVIGTHDFTSFCASGSSVEDKVRTIYEAEIRYDAQEQEIIFRFRGDGFLYKMIRILVGTLIKIGNGRMAPDSLLPIIEKRDRDLAGPTAHPEGLYLADVVYDETDMH